MSGFETESKAGGTRQWSTPVLEEIPISETATKIAGPGESPFDNPPSPTGDRSIPGQS